MGLTVCFMFAICLIWVGVLESGTSSVKDFKEYPSGKALDNQHSIRGVIAVGLVGELVVKKIISHGCSTIILEGNEEFLTPVEV